MSDIFADYTDGQELDSCKKENSDNFGGKPGRRQSSHEFFHSVEDSQDNREE